MRNLLIVAGLLALTACGGSDRPTYHGHQSSTVGVPGWSNEGNKMSPYIKLGKPYTVMGKTYVPKHQPEYNEVGMASWYGPGFHGGRTANGEEFSTHDMTAAHPTLPLPSIVRVTNLSNDRSVYVRINDRGPFAHNRIIDLSKEAAEQIDMIRTGTAKVRVEYMPAESQKFVDLMTRGRSPQSIDVASEVIGKTTEYAQAAPVSTVEQGPQVASGDQDWADFFNPISSANAQEVVTVPPPQPVTVQPVQTVPAYTPPAPVQQQVWPPPQQQQVAMPAELPNPLAQPVQPQAPPAVPVVQIPHGYFVQIGAYASAANADNMVGKVSQYGPALIAPMQVNGATLYRVRLGPLADDVAAQEILARVQGAGIGGAAIIRE